ncbi:HAD family hydrolase [Luteimonas sp. 100069]|uniref:HAD family hydrolase n=1 Tax=Luteimonas sp. 100069 TaxID=2006109 RepID=UPI000F506E2E|nr:HAD family hydrolase [Luteimonas sp. 100069]RPD87675.1 HAD family hydrolase [Luteimonas sp. 100069]
MGVFTRSPRAYANYLLHRAYPGLRWDAVVAREDVALTKPHPEGVLSAMRTAGITDAAEVAMVGDEKSDVLAAYRAGSWSVVDQTSWQRPWESACYRAMEKIPDAVIQRPAGLVGVLQRTESHLPDLERRLANGVLPQGTRACFVSINHFHRNVTGLKQPVTMLGKMFSDYRSLRPRSQGHLLTQQILEHKSAVRFPEEWIAAIRAYLSHLAAHQGPFGA